MRAKKHITLDEIGRRLALGNFKELKVIIKTARPGLVIGPKGAEVDRMTKRREAISAQLGSLRELMSGFQR